MDIRNIILASHKLSSWPIFPRDYTILRAPQPDIIRNFAFIVALDWLRGVFFVRVEKAVLLNAPAAFAHNTQNIGQRWRQMVRSIADPSRSLVGRALHAIHQTQPLTFRRFSPVCSERRCIWLSLSRSGFNVQDITTRSPTMKASRVGHVRNTKAVHRFWHLLRFFCMARPPAKKLPDLRGRVLTVLHVKCFH